jgi:hypothetical protein
LRARPRAVAFAIRASATADTGAEDAHGRSTTEKAERVTSEAAKAGTDEIMRHIAALLPEEYRGEYRAAVASAERVPAPAK